MKIQRRQKNIKTTDELEILKHAMAQAMEARGFASIANIVRIFLDKMESTGTGIKLYPTPRPK